jgi:hypothetical protein
VYSLFDLIADRKKKEKEGVKDKKQNEKKKHFLNKPILKVFQRE